MQALSPDGCPRISDPTTFFRGIYGSTGPRRQPPVHQHAVLLLGEPAPTFEKLVARGVGYNAGLVGLKRSLTIKAGETLAVPILLVAVNKPKDVKSVDLIKVLNALKAELLGGKEK